MSSEAGALRTLRKNTLTMYPGAQWQRLEDSLAVGLADVTVAIPKFPPLASLSFDDAHPKQIPIKRYVQGELWIEAKEVDALPKRASTPLRVGLRREQVIWLRAAQAAGRKVCVMVRGPWGWAWFTDHFEELCDGIPWSIFCTRWHFMSRSCDASAIGHILDPQW